MSPFSFLIGFFCLSERTGRYIYIYVYIFMYINLYIYIYLYTYIHNIRFKNWSIHPFQMILIWKFTPNPLWVLMTGYFSTVQKIRIQRWIPWRVPRGQWPRTSARCPGRGGGRRGLFGGFGPPKRWGGHRRSLTSKIFFFDFWGWKFQRWSISIAGHQSEWYGFIFL